MWAGDTIAACIYADVAELADALDLGSSGRPCRFKSCHPHLKIANFKRPFYFVLHFMLQSSENACWQCRSFVLLYPIKRVYILALELRQSSTRHAA